ncbi:MAG: MerR family transcriptional regulator [Pseudodesulfovibrio sp.]|nr:MerR family transcriptional regulator [Pseudodesulfovibrio sp.]
MADTYTHKNLAELCGVSETTIKSYRRKFPGFIPVLTRGKPIRFKSEAAAVCLRIRDCFEKGMSVNETDKVLKENFKGQSAESPRRAAAAPTESSTVSPEYLEKFFKTAGQMMQGMASLATAQVKAGQRLAQVETTLEKLVEIETRNSEVFSQLLTHLKAPSASISPTPSQAEAEFPAPEKIRARKIVNVRSPEGDVKSYSIEKNKTEVEVESKYERPSDAFLNTPIVIRNEQSEFLGVPGRLPLSGFIEILVREAEEGGVTMSHWKHKEDVWVFFMEIPGGDSHELHFASTTTPKGNLVVLLNRLDVNQKQTTPQFLQEFFRQVKDKI